MKKLFFLAVALFATTQMIACSKTRSGTSKTKTTTQQVCPAGQTMSSGGCATTSLTNGSYYGYYSEKGNTLSSGGDTLSLTSGWKELLKSGMGVCDRCANTAGASSCTTWVDGFNDLVIQPISGSQNQVKVIMRSSPKMNGYTYYYWNSPDLEGFFLGMLGLPTGCYAGIQTPRIDLTSYVDTYNNGKGFVVYGQFPFGSAWGRRSFRLYVANSKLGDSYADFTMKVVDENGNQSDLANGRLNKCQTATCGL